MNSSRTLSLPFNDSYDNQAPHKFLSINLTEKHQLKQHLLKNATLAVDSKFLALQSIDHLTGLIIKLNPGKQKERKRQKKE
jgi:hypothetical protein